MKSELVNSISVNVLSEKVLVGLDETQDVERVVEKLKALGFQVNQKPRELALDQNSKKRTIYLNYQERTIQFLAKIEDLKKSSGVLEIDDDEN